MVFDRGLETLIQGVQANQRSRESLRSAVNEELYQTLVANPVNDPVTGSPVPLPQEFAAYHFQRQQADAAVKNLSDLIAKPEDEGGFGGYVKAMAPNKELSKDGKTNYYLSLIDGLHEKGLLNEASEEAQTVAVLVRASKEINEYASKGESKKIDQI